MISSPGNHDRADKHWFTTSSRWEFSRAAATRSLSASCLLTAGKTHGKHQDRGTGSAHSPLVLQGWACQGHPGLCLCLSSWAGAAPQVRHKKSQFPPLFQVLRHIISDCQRAQPEMFKEHCSPIPVTLRGPAVEHPPGSAQEFPALSRCSAAVGISLLTNFQDENKYEDPTRED